MPRIAIIDRYIVSEIVAPFALGVGLLTFALVTGRLLKLTEMVVNHGVTLVDVTSLIGYIMPAFLELTFPMAVLLGVLMGFGRMSGDRELIAARACGLSLYRLALPVLGFALAMWAVSSWLAFSVRPWANSHLEERLYELTQTRATAGLKEKVFNRNFPGLVIYVDHVSPTDEKLHGVMISDARNPSQQNTIIAHTGIIVPDRANRSITLRLFDGSVFGLEASFKGTNTAASTHVTSYKIYDLNVRPDEGIGGAARDPEDMTYSELRRAIAKGRAARQPDYAAETELAGKYTLPIMTVLFAMLGIPLGLKPARGGQSERFGVAIALFFAYYSLMRAGEALASRGRLGALAAMSIPDVVFALLALGLFLRSAADRGDQGRGPGDVLWDLFERYGRWKEAA
ncbi:MAG TPA: LPS export ABC transporter permease LptF [Candidatus Binataceae bacterium]|nr:LPS export ABC transporter permease LptF [Candidatus Binataceae bacterium]